MVMDNDEDNEPNTCYFCRKPRECYFGMLCDECRKRAKELHDSIEKARKRGK